MSRIILVTGGCRSGKSNYAQQLGESMPGGRAYIATCPVTDEEMRLRIEAHKHARKGKGWTTIEQLGDLAGTLDSNTQFDIVLVDCITLWVSNLMHQAAQQGRDLDETQIADRARKVLDACEKRSGTVIFVTNEVGMSVVPENALARRYRDLVGRANQVIATDADVVTLVVCGVPMNIKESQEHESA
jgi:adenosylcobinamide kinase / adenosylcobinamide-phosphate guanylyltransferase